ncbi:hypothetical protein [Streptomyces sp. NPDC021356]|uniref:hypothetical protein n=1 Tax=Streptomyces sp. NPDC021356 TaxID=3154900 RepID=UPI0033E4DC1C
MQHIPTAETSPATRTTPVQRALARIDSIREDDTSPAFQQLLDHLAQMVIESGDPRAVFDRVSEAFAAYDTLELARQQGLELMRSTVQSVEDGTVSATTVFWPAHLVIVPHGQRASDTLAQLRTEVAEHQEEQHLSASFQASVASGHVEDVETWFTRTSKAAR